MRTTADRTQVSIRNAREDEVIDRKSTRLNSSHLVISYAVFCLKKKKKICIVTIDIIPITSDDSSEVSDAITDKTEVVAWMNREVDLLGTTASVATVRVSRCLRD